MATSIARRTINKFRIEIDMRNINAKSGFVISLAVALVLSGCEDRPTIAEQTGYFKDDARNRVVAFYSPDKLSRADVDALVARQTLTAGTLGRMVFYSGEESSSPADVLTLAPSLQRALELTVTPPFDQWDWMMSRNPAGETAVKENQQDRQ